MGTVKRKKDKLLVILIVFMIIFSNCGFTLKAIATSSGFEVITNGFFKKDEIKLNAYFEDENGNQITEITANVNQKVRLILELLPQVQGYLRTANLKAVSEDNSDVNFKITGMNYYQDDESLNAKSAVDLDVAEENQNEGEESVATENADVETNTEVEDTVIETNNEDENAVVSDIETTVDDKVTVEDELSGETSISTNLVSGVSNATNESVVNEVSNDVENQENIEPNSNINDEALEVNDEEILIDEDRVIEEKTEEANKEENLHFGMKILSNNEVELMNIIKNTKVALDIEYEMGETLKVEDLMKVIHLQLSGTYINSDLDEVAVAKEAVVTLGWEYTKDATLTSEFTKFSPFEVGDINGTIVENKITVTREVTENKFLPIKNTNLEVGVPLVNGEKPIEISVVAEKLLATRGEDIGYTSFNKDNWSYDAGTGKIQISVQNTNLVYTSGLDEYVIIYRYEDKIDAENSDLDKNVKLTVEEYSGKNNNIIQKEINESQSIKVDVGELVTYSISSSEEKINKAKIYANYNNEIPVYETEYASQVNVNILTTDILEELKISFNQEIYKDVNGLEFVAEGIQYRRIKFSYSEISNLLVNGGEIVITNNEGEVLYTLNKDIIKSEEDCLVNLNEQTGIILYARNIAKNGSLNFELVKVIKGCNYDKSAFKNFTSIESRISAEVKYQKVEETLALSSIGTTKEFEESSTYARLSIDKETLSTTKSNDNVEMKIELNNDKENSDLYINPAFEIVFPKYVKDVTVQNLNVLYENGLKISEFTTYKKNDIIVLRVELEGVQKTFCESSMTNGTNILINVNIKVDEYTPKKEDIIKLYYCNEGVSNYESQTKWSISKNIPNGILKTTNGFDGAVIKYQAPNGLVAINGIVNYDGMLSEVKSVKQGEVKQQIPIGASSRIMTMELLALNNTDNKCSDVVLLGRIPFVGNKDVITDQDLGTTTNTVMKDLIKESIQNTNTVDIYYSSNPDATKDLDNIGNGWTKDVSNLSEVKSFLIFVKGAMVPGQVLRYTYDFEVPENLPYDTNIEGSFGAFYNNNTDVAVIYESMIADTVGLTTEAGLKLEGILTVDAGDGNTVGECTYLKYKLKVKNTGSVVASDLTITIPVPNNTRLWEFDKSDLGIGNNNYTESKNQNERRWKIEVLNPGEEKEIQYTVKVDKLDDNEVVVKSKATITASNLGVTIESNETSNKVEKRNLDLMINTEISEKVEVGGIVDYRVYVTNISGKDLENIKVVCKLPKEYEYKETKVSTTDSSSFNEDTIVYDETNHEVTLVIEEIQKDGLLNLRICGEMRRASNDIVATHVSFYPEEDVEERTSEVSLKVVGPILEVNQEANADSVLEGENVEFAIQIQNKGNGESKELKIKDEISKYLENVKVRFSGSTQNSNVKLTDGNLDNYLSRLQPNSQVVVTISGTAKNLEEGVSEAVVTNKAIISGDYIHDIETDIAEVIIKYNPNKVEEEPKKEGFNNIISGDDTDDEDDYNTEPSDSNVNNGTFNNSYQNNNTNNSSNNSSDNSNQQNDTNIITNNKTNNTQSSNDTNNQANNQNIIKYKISGTAWLDSNKDGKRDSDEKTLATLKVQLQKDGRMIKAVTTDGNGEYKFEDLTSGRYSIIFLYDEEKYTTTSYRVQSADASVNSDAIETQKGTAVTNDITITDSDITNIDIGLKEKEIFDLKIDKYLTKATVKTEKDTKSYDFDNEKLAKVEIHSKEINNAIVDVEYRIVVENLSSIEGSATKIIDQMPEGMTFDEKRNTGWYLGNDGNLYNETLKDVRISAGEKAELKLILTKVMTEDNVGVSSNTILLSDTMNSSELKENTDNNVSTQEILILISTNGSTMAILASAIAVLLIIIIYLNRGKINISFGNNYKNKSNKKVIIKKIYK